MVFYLNMLAESLSKRSFVFSSGKSRCLLAGSVYALLKSRLLVAPREHPQLQMPQVQKLLLKGRSNQSLSFCFSFPKDPVGFRLKLSANPAPSVSAALARIVTFFFLSTCGSLFKVLCFKI